MSEWTVDTLKEYADQRCAANLRHIDDKFESINQIFIARDEAQQIAMTAAQRAVDKAERLADLRAASQDAMAKEHALRQNEWRATINDVISERLTRREWEQGHNGLIEKLDALERRHDADLMEVRQNLSESKGRGVGQHAVVLWLFVGLTALISIAAIILDLSVPH